jgi:hypothetical protein
VMPLTTSWNYISTPTNISSNTTLTPPAGGSNTAPNYYRVSGITKTLTLNPAVVSGNTVETFIAVHVEGDISGNTAGINVNPHVHAKIFFDGNVSGVKAQNFVNSSPDTPGYPSSGPFSGNLQFYGISPPPDSNRSQTVNLDSGGGQPQLFMTVYAPSADVTLGGAPDFYGTIVAKTFYANGNITWHYDRALNDVGDVQDFQIASYVEDTR